MKKVLYVILGILMLIGIRLTSRYLVNQSFISKFEEEKYTIKPIKYLKFMNTTEGYVAYYNGGNYYYRTEQYEKAVEEYETALKKAPKKKKCDIRVNLSLTKLNMIEYKENENLIDDLRAVQEILLGNDCATADQKGKDKDAQQLYDEIEEYIKKQQSQDPQQDPQKDPQQDPQQQDPDKPQDNPEKEKEIEKKIRQQQQQGQKSREGMKKKQPDYSNHGKNW